MVQAVGDQFSLTPFQYAQLFAFALEYAPDVILELGRGHGNSTAAFTEAANRLPGCRVISLCDTHLWREVTAPRLGAAVDDAWFQPLTALECDILAVDFATLLRGARRVLVFWDAHGFEVAQCVLGTILPVLADRDHIVVMHDVSDTRYCGAPAPGARYAMWKGGYTDVGDFRIAGIASKVPQAIAALDFVHRNRLTFESADHSIAQCLTNDPEKVAWMQRELGEFYDWQAWWYWFTLNERAGPYSFPKTGSTG